MTTDKPSRSPTLADVLDVVAHVELGEKPRGEMTSAIRTVGRVLNRPLDQIPADSNALRRRLDEVSPVAVGISRGRWANVRSLLRRALNLAKNKIAPAFKQAMSPKWSALFQCLTKAGQMRVGRLLRFLSELQIEPAFVTSEHLEKFRDSLQADALARNPNKTWRLAIGVWNSSRRNIPGWPDLHLCPPSRRDTYTLPWTTFPPSFKTDAEAFLARMSGVDLLEEMFFRPVRASTLETRRWQLLASASALVHRGKDPSAIRSLADLVELESFKEILRFFVARRGNTSSSMIENLARFLKSVARHWVEAEAAVLDKMSAVIKNVTVVQAGMTTKNRQRLSPFKDEENLLMLLHLPERLMREARSARYSKAKSALLAQTAVAIELLIMRPLRIGNLAGLELHRHLIRRKNGSWDVIVSADQVKNEVDLEHDLPGESCALLECYLRDFRPLLATPGNTALIPGKSGCGTKTVGTLRGQIGKLIHHYTGLIMNPHLFRHFAGFVHLNAHPAEHAIVAHVLGHKSINTTTRHYTGLERTAAVRHFDKTIIGIRARHLPGTKNVGRGSRRNRPIDPKDGER